MSSADEQRVFGQQPAALSDPDAQLRPFDWYSRMRRDDPVRFDPGRGCWDVFRYDDVKRVLQDHETFSSERGRAFDDEDGDGDDATGALQRTMISVDPPEHDRLRSPVDEFFRPGAVRELRPRIEAITDDLLDDAVAAGEFDFVSEVAYPIPVVVIAELLGVPPEDREQFKEWSDLLVASPPDGSPEEVRAFQQEVETAQREMGTYFWELVTERRADPRDDLLSEIVHADVDGDPLTDREVLGFCMLLLVAGNITTTNLLTNAVWSFDEHDLVGDLAAGDLSLEHAVEEVLRYRSPVQSMTRVAATDVELGGTEIPEGDVLVAWIGSANRDGDAFDAPDEFRPGRSPNRHIAFGHGVHYCLGAPLARLEADVVLSSLLDRVTDLRVAADDLRPVESQIVYGVESLPVAVET